MQEDEARVDLQAIYGVIRYHVYYRISMKVIYMMLVSGACCGDSRHARVMQLELVCSKTNGFNEKACETDEGGASKVHVFLLIYPLIHIRYCI